MEMEFKIYEIYVNSFENFYQNNPNTCIVYTSPDIRTQNSIQLIQVDFNLQNGCSMIQCAELIKLYGEECKDYTILPFIKK